MPALPRVFVSHSSDDGPLTTSVRDHLVPDPHAPDIELLLDIDRLEPGWEWEPFLHEWMARCDAALILLTENAAASDYVLKEATILAWRVAMDPTFQLFVAQFPGALDDDEIERRYSPLRLDRIQRVPDLAPDQIARTVSQAVADTEFGPSPFDQIVDRLSDLLEDVGPGTLRLIAGKLGVVREWAPSDIERTRYLQQIARHLICGLLGDYELDAAGAQGIRGLNGLIGDLAGVADAERLYAMLDLMAPHWVDNEAIGALAVLPFRRIRRAVAINGAHVQHYTSRMYLRRAHPLTTNYYFLDIAGGNDGDLVTHIKREVCSAVRSEYFFLAGASDDEVITALRTMEPIRFVLLAQPLPDEAELEQLLGLMPTVNFVLATGNELPADPTYGRVDYAEPAVDCRTEMREMMDWSDSLNTIKRKELHG